ncbi:MAG: RNA-directed DNA polymerase [Dolichospermum sp. DET50]|nr:RNA-directed DNA polymerase [Dolichospermum sp. DET66]MBS3034208.1 RNA-directed DNA polymerase [Dolichospermum sp. DET67]MBS3039411.1 RNA-directed DNA polymerase [Dolichospermum sp. DET50]QSX66633.1 MAG: RNA-directed DNA polymerase [Dolichospermum sp. DET69]
MISKKDIEQRLQDLDWTLYRLAKEFAELRANRTGAKEVPPASRYHTSLGKAIDNPGASKLETIEDIVQVLNGEFTILWEAGKVVTIRLEEETLEALKQRAENEGKTINAIAKQLLLQALSGLPSQKSKQVTNLVMAEEAKIRRSFHPIIASAYSAVHQWLGEIPDAQGYKELNYSKDILHCLEKGDLKSTAFQFYSLFPRYYFESVHILDSVIESNRLLNRLRYHPRIYLLDVGCVMGAATAAFIEKILTLPKDDITSKKIEIINVGIDPNIYGYAIYQKFMQELQEKINPFNITLDFKAINQPLAPAILSTISHLQNKLNDENASVKALSNLFIMQLDLASSISQDDLLQKERNKKLKALGLAPEIDTDIEKEFWQDEALSFKRLLEEVPIENLHLTTIGTKKLEQSLKQIIQASDINEGINAICTAFDKFMGKHRISYVMEGKQAVDFENPAGSYWYEQNKLNHADQFNAVCQTIKNSELEEDNEWNKLISLDNIELAWVKARNNIFNESFYDEVEIRLFENNLDENLQILIDNLVDKLYSDKLLPSGQDIDYKFVKSRSKGRPKQLTRLEEEILAIAILQTIGKNKDFDFYSYQLKLEQTEDLYENYFPRYTKFLKASEESAKSCPKGAVLRTDIQEYYKQVIQQQLLDITITELEIRSDRIKWLLTKIMKQNLNNGHENGSGLKQGTLTSGFYANLYLKAIDDYFANEPKWKHKINFHRYVDDIIAVAPNGNDIEKFEIELIEKLSNLGLKLNKEKTEHYKKISDFLPSTELDDHLKELNKNFNSMLVSLWIMDHDYRTEFELANSSHDDQSWWKFIKLYQHCLYSLGIYVTEINLSRRIYQKLNYKKSNSKEQLEFPSFPTDDNFIIISQWSIQFQELNRTWIYQKNQIKSQVVNLFKESLKNLQEIIAIIKDKGHSISEQEKRKLNINKRKSETRIRTSVNKLLILGFDQVWEELIFVICDLFVIRNLLDVIIALASQGHRDAIKQLWQYYQNSNIATEESSEYVRAILLESLRFLPILKLAGWELIFTSATAAKSDIEKLKATETWLYLGHLAKPYVQPQHLQSIVNALKNDPPPFTRLKKNYILILGMYNYDLLDNIPLSNEEKNDYLIKDALKLAESGKVSELFKEIEPARVRQYYNPKQKSATKDKQYSL